MTHLPEDDFVRAFISALTDAYQEQQIGLLLRPAVPNERNDWPHPPVALAVAALNAIILYDLSGIDPMIDRAVDRGRSVIGIDMPDRQGAIGIGVTPPLRGRGGMLHRPISARRKLSLRSVGPHRGRIKSARPASLKPPRRPRMPCAAARQPAPVADTNARKSFAPGEALSSTAGEKIARCCNVMMWFHR